MKKILAVLLAALFTMTAGIGAAQANVQPAPDIKVVTPDVTIDDIGKHIVKQPLLVDDHLYLPVRSYANLFPGAEVLWDSEERIAMVSYDEAVFVAPVEGSPYLTEGKILTDQLKESLGIDNLHSAPAILIMDHAYVPLRALVEALGGEVIYDETSHLVSLKLQRNILSAPSLRPDFESLDKFAHDTAPLFLSSEGTNESYSPLSLYMALSMVAQGAKDTTLEEILTLLNAKDTAKLSREAMTLAMLNQEDEKGVLKIANSLWVDKAFDVNESYRKSLKKNYNAAAEKVNMRDKKDLARISKWIADRTNNLIDITFDPSDSVVKLVNTVYFKGLWENAFSEENTSLEPFYLKDKKEVMAPTMRQSLKGAYMKNELFEGASLPFKDGSRLHILLPNQDKSTADIIANLKNFDRYAEKAETYDINWQLPKFAFSSDYDCVNKLRKLGLEEVFTPVANLSGIGDNLMISGISQFNRIQIDEKGSEAASATIVDIKVTAMPPQDMKEVNFIVDRPFVFLLETKDGLPLFIGQVSNPAAE